MKSISMILEIINIAVILYGVYYLITGIFVFIKKKKNGDYKEKLNKFAIIIPARNEELVIGNLLDSLNKQNYNKNMYDIYVVPNNCTDNTESVSKSKNAKIILPDIEIHSKGEALKYTFEYIQENINIYDAYIIFDADNVVHPDFIKEMNITLCNGYKIAQGYRDSKNPSDTWISSCYSLHYLIQNVFVDKARMNMHEFCYINGTGFMIANEILEKNPYNTKTMTEDIEFTMQNLIAGNKIAFVEKAITYDEQSLKFEESIKQRKRWSIGTMQCLERYVLNLIKTKNIKGLDGLIFCISPIIQVISMVTCIIPLLLDFIIYENFNLEAIILSLITTYLISILVAVLAIKLNKKEVKLYIKGILTLPIFILSWIPINIYAIFKRDINWEPIKHTRTISIENIIVTKT